jgi:hypothetical protein
MNKIFSRLSIQSLAAAFCRIAGGSTRESDPCVVVHADEGNTRARMLEYLQSGKPLVILFDDSPAVPTRVEIICDHLEKTRLPDIDLREPTQAHLDRTMWPQMPRQREASFSNRMKFAHPPYWRSLHRFHHLQRRARG